MLQNDENGGQHCTLFPPIFAIYYAFAFLFEENLSQICIRNHKKMLAKMLVFALQLAPKCTAISIKTQGEMHQNARHLASKRKTKCTKTQIKGIKSGLRGVIYRQIAPYR